MNANEGMRRFALFLGCIGAILGCTASYLELQNIQNQTVRHNRFERLADSDVVKQERVLVQRTTPDPIAPEIDTSSPEFDPVQAFIELPENKKSAVVLQLSPEKQTKLFNQVRSLRLNGIRAIHWTQDLGIASIETDEGQTLYPTPTPSRWLYIWSATLPLIGFLSPWGMVRALEWVRAGFTASAK